MLGKLRTMQLVKADFQLLMRIFVNERMVGVIETDERISKGNYGSRKGYSIDDLMIEKRLLCDCSMRNMEQTVHNFADLESCYDRQLANVCGVVKESVGVDRMAIKSSTKVTLRFEHCICTNFGISEESNGVCLIL